MRISDYRLYSATNVAADAQTASIDMEQQIGLSVQVDWSGASGSTTVTLQASNDGQTWVNLSSSATISTASGTAMLFATDFMYKFARVDINHSSGTISSLRMQVLAKGL